MQSDLSGYAVLTDIPNRQIEIITRTLFTDVVGGFVCLSRLAVVRGDNVIGRVDRSVVGEIDAVGRVVSRSGSIVDGISGDRVV